MLEKRFRKGRVPRLVLWYLRRLFHEDFLNGFFEKGYSGMEFCDKAIDYLGITLQVEGEVPDGGPYTFVSNHPLGGIDGVAIGSIIGRHYDNKFKYLVNDLLMNLPGLAPLCIGINKTGSQSRNFPAMVETGFSSDDHMVMFPAGLCSRKIDGKIQDIPWKKTFITKSVEHRRDIVPIHFSGHNSMFFYRLANICKMLGIKFNIAMLFLVDEMYKNRHQSFQITIGKPISWQTFDKSKTPTQWAQEVRARVYQLPKEK